MTTLTGKPAIPFILTTVRAAPTGSRITGDTGCCWSSPPPRLTPLPRASAQLREQEDKFNSANVSIAVVTFENDFFARQYVEETRLTWPLLIDTSREVYRGYGMLAASFGDVWGQKAGGST